MTTIVDVSQDAGDSRRITEELAAEIAAQDKPANPPSGTQKQTQASGEDPRFANKSREDILDMYRNLESHQGRLANELGQQRRTLDQLLLDKRASDLQSNGQPTHTELTASELLERPSEAVERVVEAKTRTTLQPLEQRLAGLEQQLAAQQVTRNHGSDWEQTVRTPEFASWASKTQLRMALVTQARNGNWQAADTLLTEFKDARATAAPNEAETAAQRAAAKVGLESVQAGSDGGAVTSRKRYRQQDLWALRVNNPDEYERPEVQAEIMRAYKEGRVIRS